MESKDLPREDTFPRESIDERVMSNLEGFNVDIEMREEIIEEVCNALEREGVSISYE